MTDQVLDSIQVFGVGYELVAEDPGVFSPWDYGIEPHSICSSNWSGYVAGFEVRDRRLYLSSLSVGWAPPKRITGRDPAENDPLGLDQYQPQTLPELNGVAPKPISGSYMLYTGVGMPLDYTGRLIGSGDYPDSLEGLMEFVFESGVLIEVIERSQDALGNSS
ncbi:hypothetical protein [Marinobacter pelagius]|uniref:Uncharacterized protein n=1 Tax=Marinobacter pelagius TaxID=379482 RepID=A0A1I4XGE3_9GAMM|nr:hypothetical protein [Marinobacter pelagius]SFN24606.1 hypothetical protein SAMN04487961_2562 [Marinobacter pelagius]